MMTPMKTTIVGLPELVAKLNRMPDVLARKLYVKAVAAGAREVKKEVIARAPVRNPSSGKAGKKISKSNPTLRYPGNLKKHISQRRVQAPGTQKVIYEIKPGALAWYGRFVETGTRLAAAHPFMRPALDAAGGRAVTKTAEVIRDGLPEVVKSA